MTTRQQSPRTERDTASDDVGLNATNHCTFIRPGGPEKAFRLYTLERGCLMHSFGNLSLTTKAASSGSSDSSIILYQSARLSTASPDKTEPDDNYTILYIYSDWNNPNPYKQPPSEQVPWTEAGMWGRWYYANIGIPEQSTTQYAAMLIGIHLMQTGPSDNYYEGALTSGQIFSWGASKNAGRDCYINNAFTDTQLWGTVSRANYDSYGPNWAPAQHSVVPGGCRYIYNASTARVLFDGYWYPGLTRADYLWGFQVYNASGVRLLATLEGGPRHATDLTTNGGLVMGLQLNSNQGESDSGQCHLARIGTTDPTAFSQEYRDNLYCPPGTVIDNFKNNRTGTLDGRHVEWIDNQARQYSSGLWELKGGVSPTYVTDATYGVDMIQFNSDPAVDFIWLDYDTDIHVAVSFDLGAAGTGEITFIFRYKDNQNYEYYYVTAGGYSYGEYVAGVGSEITASGSRTNRFQNTINFVIQKTHGTPVAANINLSSVLFNGDRVDLDSGGTPPTGITNGIGFSANKDARVSCVKICPDVALPDGIPNKWGRGYLAGKSEYSMIIGGVPSYNPRHSRYAILRTASSTQRHSLVGLESAHGNMQFWCNNNSSGFPLAQYQVTYKSAGYIQLEGRHHNGTGGGGTPLYLMGMCAEVAATRFSTGAGGYAIAMNTNGFPWRGKWALELNQQAGYFGDWTLNGYGMCSFERDEPSVGPPHTGGHADLDDGWGTVYLNWQGGNYPLGNVTIDQKVALHPNIPCTKVMVRIMRTRHMNDVIGDENRVKFIPGTDATWDLSGTQYFFGPKLRFTGIDATFLRWSSSSHNTTDVSSSVVPLYIGSGEPDETTAYDNNWATKIYGAGASGAFTSSTYDHARWYETFSSGTGSIDGVNCNSGEAIPWTVIGALGANASTLQTNGQWSYGGGSRKTLAYLDPGTTEVSCFLWSRAYAAAEVMLAFRIVDGSNFWLAGFWTDETAVEVVRFVSDTATVMATHTRAKFYDPSEGDVPFINIAVRSQAEDILLQNRFYTDVGAMTADTTHNTATKFGLYNQKSGNPGNSIVERFALYDLSDPKYLEMWKTMTGADS